MPDWVVTIPTTTLNQWAAYPGPARSAAAHARVRGVLEVGFRLAGHNVDIYLQGSYRNYVNTTADSDVDIVAELTSICEFDTSHLTPWDARRFWENMQYSDYTYERFRADVQSILKNAFGGAVVEHAKAIEVKGNWMRMKVDVLPSWRYRQIHCYDGVNFTSYDGIVFWVEGRRIVNWPRQHFDSGVAKNEATKEQFKPAVRMIKNARRVAIDRGLLRDGIAPSYFVQALVWNVPNECFVGDSSATYCNIADWLFHNRMAFDLFRCQNNIEPLFGPRPEQWTKASAVETQVALTAVWTSWH